MANIEGYPTFLRVETPFETEGVQLPPYLKMMQEITDDCRFSSKNLAKSGFIMDL
jgi:CYTH domain-containing protein